ncbi:MAG: oligopeptide/dipeptide ABC transporter ATP-binding protein [Bacillota bacterium]
MVPLVELKELTRFFYLRPTLLARALAGQRQRVIKAVDRVSLAIHQGETLGLVGESGCGKTTLGRTLLFLHQPTSGTVLYRGKEVTHATREFRSRAQIIFQNPYASLNPRKKVRDIISVPLITRGIRDPFQRQQEILSLLDRVGLSPRHIDNYPHQFSGGQRQRIGIARALAMQPEFVVADEPVSSLDVSVQAQIINLLEELQQELGLTFLFIAHDLSVIYHVSDRVAVMYLGRVVELAPTARIYESPLHPYTRALLSAIPSVDPGGRRERILLEGTVPTPIDPPGGCRFHSRCFCSLGDVCREEEPRLATVSGTHQVACHRYPGE